MDKKILLSKVKDKIAFNKENPTELISQLVKVLNRDLDSNDAKDLVSKLKNLSSEIFKVWKR